MKENNFEYLFYFLKKWNIHLDETEFLFQMESHPNYPSLVAISDTLNFFNIDNVAVKVEYSEIDMLPDLFVALIKTPNDELQLVSQLYFFERRNGRFFFTKNKRLIEISKTELEERWNNVALIINNPGIKKAPKINSQFNWFYILILGSCAILTFLIKPDVPLATFAIFSFLGLFLSILALKDLFGFSSKFVNDFCNISTTTDCNAIITSDKLPIFKLISFSDLSIIFFASQNLEIIIFSLIRELSSFFAIQAILSLISFPLLFLSLYFQKYIEKKWCPICLSIIATVILQFVFLLFFTNFKIGFTLTSCLLFVSLFLMVFASWIFLKGLFTERKALKEFQLKSNRFFRNYDLFKNSLLAGKKIESFPESVFLGNATSSTTITIVTNPFCKYCKDLHIVINDILLKYSEDIKIELIISVDLSNLNKDTLNFYRQLLNVYFKKGQQEFRYALDFWFEKQTLTEWNNLYFTENLDVTKIDQFYAIQSSWCKSHGFTYTPIMFVNDYRYPAFYERENLVFFIAELIEDKF